MKYWSSPPGIQVAPRPPWPWPCGGRFIVHEIGRVWCLDLVSFFAFLLSGACGVHSCQ
ncbi:hypothetical protein BDW60DRAFT_200068 [Aspergillus nidulans var. acristatus]